MLLGTLQEMKPQYSIAFSTTELDGSRTRGLIGREPIIKEPIGNQSYCQVLIFGV
jgi:hypothetical protein